MRAEDYTHVNVCKEALLSNTLFNNFKYIPEYREVLEHVRYDLGIEYAKIISKHRKRNDFNWQKILLNDSVGNPHKCDFKPYLDVKIDDYSIAPTTLRYVATGISIIQYAKKCKLSEIDIIEIGGGYGGQCKILYDLCETMPLKIKSYTIVDLPDVCDFQKKYLDLLGYSNINYEKFEQLNLNKRYDLLVSNYAMGEFSKEIQDYYIEKVVKFCDYWYMVWNLSDIHEYFKGSTVLPEVPQTGTNNKLILK
jgi:putative sugar O-methyltransferase